LWIWFPMSRTRSNLKKILYYKENFWRFNKIKVGSKNIL